MKILVILVIFSLHRNTKNKGKKLWFSSSMAIYHLRKIVERRSDFRGLKARMFVESVCASII
ncbi:hypothetical protein V6Z12_A08G032900 [Gossypium hirsutum]